MKNFKRILLMLVLPLAAAFTLHGQTPLADNGKLYVDGVQLVNEAGNPVQLRGMSTHGINWYPQCYKKASIKALADDWGADIIRAAMYVSEQYNGYKDQGNRASLEGQINDIVTWTEELGLYCLIDWHVLNPGDPTDVNYSEAKNFFAKMSLKYKDKKHILYEICNEPNPGAPGQNYDDSWATIKSYAEDIIPEIRKNDPKAVIIVGTPNWSQEIWDVVGNELDYDNIMYTFHFYAGTHGGLYDNFAQTVKKIPVFCTEWGLSEADGDGTITADFKTTAAKFLDHFAGGNADGIKTSWCAWAYADKDETSNVLKPNSCSSAQWNNTTPTGDWIKARMVTADTWIPACALDADVYSIKSTVYATANAGATPFTYTLNGTSNSTGTFTGIADGSHTLSIEDGSGCSQDYTVTVNNATYVALASAISSATTKLNNATVGSATGNVSQAAHDDYSSAISAAKSIEQSSSTSVGDAELALATLNSATEEFTAAIIEDASNIVVTNLAAKITTAQDYIDNSSQGTSSGEYPASAFTALNSAIATAESIEASPVSQTQVDGAVTSLQIAIQKFIASKVQDAITAIVIDKCEDGDGTTEVGGKWYTYNDSGDGGKSTTDPVQGADFTMSNEGYNSTKGAKMTFNLDGGTCSWCPNVGLGFNLNEDKTAYDLTGATGISFYHKGRGFTLEVNQSNITNYQNFASKIPVADHDNWTLVDIKWADLAQPDWGDGNVYVTWDLKKITKFQFKITGANNAYSYILLDDVQINGDFTPVVENNVPALSKSIADIDLAEGYGAKIVSLSSTFTDLDGDVLQLSATSSDKSVATVKISGTSLIVTEVGSGITSIKVTASDGNGGTVSDTFVLSVEGTSFVAEKIACIAQLFPSPIDDVLYIDTDEIISSISIFTLDGTAVFATNTFDGSIPVDNLNTGTYIVQIGFSSGAIEVQRVMKR